MAVMVLLAVALPSVVRAAPRGADRAVPGTGRSGTEAARLVTGDRAQINAVIAGSPPTAILAINPVPVPEGVTPPNPYPPGTTIVGNELRAEVGGFRAWFNLQASDWDPDGDGSPTVRVFQVSWAAWPYWDSDLPGDQPDLAHAVVPCNGNIDCVAAFGEAWAECGPRSDGFCRNGTCVYFFFSGGPCTVDADCSGRFCLPLYADVAGTGRPDGWCAPDGGGCSFALASADFEPEFALGAVSAAGRPDGGIVYYGGTLVLDIPPGAKGKYTVPLDTGETFMDAPGTPPVEIPTLAATGFVVNIVAGRCCFGLRTPDEGCINGVLRGECGDDEPGPFIFTPEERCPPQGRDCAGVGACCDVLSGQCEDQVLEFDCQGTHRTWSRNSPCNDVECTTQTGACCRGDPFGPCADDTVLSDCRCSTCTWHKLQACDEIDCAPTPIPTVSEWGLAALTLLLMIGAKIVFGGRVEASSSPTRGDAT